MTNEGIYEKVMRHKPNKEFGVKGSFSWDDIDALMTEAVKNCHIGGVSQQRELLIDFYSKQLGGMNDTNKGAIFREVDNYLKSINCG